MKPFRYYCVARPPRNDWLPYTIMAEESFEERRYIPEIDCIAWGWVEYARPLPMADVANYELISAPLEVE